MAYADPQSTHNPTAGQAIPAAWGDIVRDDLQYLSTNKPHCRVYNSANLSISNAALTALTFNSERFDVGGCHSTSSNTDRITVPSGEGGKYLIGAGVRFAANSTGYRYAGIYLNGASTALVELRLPNLSADVVDLNLSTVYALAAGDYVTVQVFQNSGGALNVTALGNSSPEFWAMWMAV